MRRDNKMTVKEFLMGVAMFGVMILAFAIVGKNENTYQREATIIELGVDDVIACEDSNGNIWEFEGSGYQVGDEVVLVMDTNCTSNTIYDDMIINIK